MVIRVNRKRAIAKAVEWSDQDRNNPIGFYLKCPHCRKEQWAGKKEFYLGIDGAKNNYRCKKCGKGLAKRRLSHHKGYPEPSHGFAPKCPGWRSIYSNRRDD